MLGLAPCSIKEETLPQVSAPSYDANKPPDTPPAHNLSFQVRSTQMALVLPPILSGP